MAKSEEFQTISVNLPRALVKQMQDIKYNKGVSVSAIVEAAVSSYFEDLSDEFVGDMLRNNGAALRRS